MSALVYCPFPDADSAKAISAKLLSEGLIACANIGQNHTSLFVWQGETSESVECGVLFKTDATLLDRAMARLESLHPYETPAIVGWPCEATPATRAWLAGVGEETKQ